MNRALPLSLTFGLLALSTLTHAEWPTWRGPNGDGTVSPTSEESYLSQWSGETGEGVLWKTPLSDPGNASPVVHGPNVYVPFANATTRGLLAFDTETGKERWRHELPYPTKEITHRTNPHSSASPLVVGDRVYAWLGNAGLVALSHEGKEIWTKDLGKSEHFWGAHAASPVEVDGKIIIHFGPGNDVRLVALEAATGETVWDVELPDGRSPKPRTFMGSWSTPVVVRSGPRTELVFALPKRVVSFSASDGELLWSCDGPSKLCYTSVIVGPEHFIYCSGYGGPALCMRRPNSEARGDLTSSHRLYLLDQEKHPQRIGTGQIIGGHLYLFNETGVAQCYEVATGKELWKERFGKKTWASPCLVGGLFYVPDFTGTTHVVRPNSEKLEVIASNPLKGTSTTNASAAFSNGRIFLRTHEALWCIGSFR